MRTIISWRRCCGTGSWASEIDLPSYKIEGAKRGIPERTRLIIVFRHRPDHGIGGLPVHIGSMSLQCHLVTETQPQRDPSARQVIWGTTDLDPRQLFDNEAYAYEGACRFGGITAVSMTGVDPVADLARILADAVV